LGTFCPASHFRKTLYRPDIIKRLLETGSLEVAYRSIDQKLGKVTRPTDVAQVLPPTVAITLPSRSGIPVTQSRLEVTAVARSVSGHPVSGLRLLLDGRTYPGNNSVITVREPKLGKVTANWNVTLPRGSHHLAVQASSAVSQGLSDEVEVIYTPSDQRLAKT